MKTYRVISFKLNKFTSKYVEIIENDVKEDSPTKFMNKLLSDYFKLKYGIERWKEIRMKVLGIHENVGTQ